MKFSIYLNRRVIVMLCTILYIKFSFLRFRLPANVSQPVSKYKEVIDENIGSLVTILVAFNCTCSSLFASVWLQPSQTSLNHANVNCRPEKEDDLSSQLPNAKII